MLTYLNTLLKLASTCEHVL